MTSTGRPQVTVIGMGADGWLDVPDRLRTLVELAPVVLGGRRHLDLLPDIAGQVREQWPRSLRTGLPDLLERYAGQDVVALASGDPLVSGIGSTLVELLGADAVQVEPAVSSLSLARARMGWAAADHDVVSLVGRDPRLLLRALAPGRRVLVLSSDETTPAVVAGLLVEGGWAASHLSVLGDLGGPTESRVEGVADGWAADVSRLNVIALEVVGHGLASWSAGLPDSAYEHDGQLTKRDPRASALARLAPAPGQLLWDVGAGAGSIGIEWMRAHPACRTVAVESHPARAARIARNASALGVPGLEVVHGLAPDALTGLPAPDAVFVGGGATHVGVVDACVAGLKPGGRLVVHGVTLETEHVMAHLHAKLGGELTRTSVERAEPIGSFTGWAPARTVTQWAYVKEQS